MAAAKKAKPKAPPGAPRKRRGPPTLLTAVAQQTICNHVRAGAYRSTACEAAGIARSTLTLWLDHARRDSEAGRSTVYSRFADALARAEAECITRDIIRIKQHGSHDWKALAWTLERRFPKLFGPQPRAAENSSEGTLANLTALAFDGNGGGSEPDDGDPDR